MLMEVVQTNQNRQHYSIQHQMPANSETLSVNCFALMKQLHDKNGCHSTSDFENNIQQSIDTMIWTQNGN